MTRTLDEIIAALPEQRRRAVEARARALAEEVEADRDAKAAKRRRKKPGKAPR